jgi:formylglycine-generating enzyme required for sulfatase activity
MLRRDARHSADSIHRTAGPPFAEAEWPREAIDVPGGRAEVGRDRPVFIADGEGPSRLAPVKTFQVDRAAVTNARFLRFVEETEYVTLRAVLVAANRSASA